MSRKIVVHEKVYEYQKRPVFSVYNSFDVPSEWVDEHKKPRRREDIDLPSGWTWSSEWKHSGSDSWEYHNDWSDVSKEWSSVPGIFYYGRRRLWQRSRIKVCSEEEI